jgi:hypothetical protein
LVDAKGRLVAKRRISDAIDGFAVLVEVLADAGHRGDENRFQRIHRAAQHRREPVAGPGGPVHAICRSGSWRMRCGCVAQQAADVPRMRFT